MLGLATVFLVLVFVVARRQGLHSILGMIASFLVIFIFIVPYISRGANPIIISLVGASIIIPSTFYLSHGINIKTTVAIIGTIISLTVIGIVASIMVDQAYLTGLVYEEVETLLYVKEGDLNLRGLLIAGIIIGTLGILDDISVSQSSIVHQLMETSPNLSFKELYEKAMTVGRDHIASVVNTLILVYTGSALSTLLLFIEFPRPLSVILNNEIVAIQIVIALLGSIGLILTVPITTYIACIIVNKHEK